MSNVDATLEELEKKCLALNRTFVANRLPPPLPGRPHTIGGRMGAMQSAFVMSHDKTRVENMRGRDAALHYITLSTGEKRAAVLDPDFVKEFANVKERQWHVDKENPLVLYGMSYAS